MRGASLHYLYNRARDEYKEKKARIFTLHIRKKMYDNAINVLRERARNSNERKKIHTFIKGMV
jgi:hypothetical protein